ncbi:hypothetical protein [Amnibacterium kyonggiense]
MSADEALRRRLYRPGADEADVAAYRSAVAQREDPAAGPPARAAAPPRRRWRPAALAATLLVLVGTPFALHLVAAPPAPTATPLPTARVADATAARLVAALDAGRDAGLGPWLPPGAPALETRGTGSATVALPVSPSGSGGRLLVVLVSDRDATAGWATARFVIHDDRTIHLRTATSVVGAVRAGVPARSRVVYAAGQRPQRLLVRAPADVRWGVAIVFAP